VVYGYDRLHRLYREVKSKTYLNVKDSDLASQIASSAGLRTNVEQTRIVYDHLYQHNQSDLNFLMQRAWRIGYECFVDDGTLVFRRPVHNDAAVTLEWGADLRSFQPRMTLAEQVEETIVKGWDVEMKAAIVGRAKKGQLYPKISEAGAVDNWTSALGNKGKMIIVDQPVFNQTEADLLAAARLDEISGAFIEAEGTAFRRPEIRAGKVIKLEKLGRRLSGTYLVTHATHRYTAEGIMTTFGVRGTRTGLLAEQLTPQTPLDRWPGVVSAIVTNTDDPQKWGRVKVKFPWMADDAESDWARVVGSGAGANAGFCSIPAVNDEVVVAFRHGDFGQPVVLGGLWNGKDALPKQVADVASGEQPQVRTWQSPKGHQITLYDNGDNKLEIKTAGGHQVLLDDAGTKIMVKSSGGLTVTLDDGGQKITVESGGDIELNATAGMTLKANGTFKVNAASMNLEASGPVTIKGAMINLN
jgi:phage baseplate assembly protein gpV